jgi:ribosomal protein L13
MTPFIKKKEIKKDWYIINAQNAVVGRLAAYISNVLRGKNKPTYNPHMDNGDFIVVTNVNKIKFTGKKFKDKKYYRHTGHPGGIKISTPLSLTEKNKTEEILTKIDDKEDIYEEFEVTRNKNGEVIMIDYIADFGESSDSVTLRMRSDGKIMLTFGSYGQHQKVIPSYL